MSQPRAGRAVIAPAAVLFTVMVAHSVLETARDALFLSRLGPDRLALVYLVMAGLALAAFGALRRWGGVREPRRALLVFLGVATIGTALLAATITISPYTVFALYVWTGLAVTMIVPTFWTTLDRSVRVGDAKRLFAPIAAGGVVGAIVGSSIAALVGRVVDARWLVSVGALAYGGAAVVAFALAPRAVADEPAPRRAASLALERRSGRYIRTLIALGVLSMFALTVGDLLFKRVLAAHVGRAELAATFGTIYAALNVVGLAIQLLITPRLLARWGAALTLSALPVVLAATGLGFAATGALALLIALKLADGGLRHSVHNVGTEILYLPLPSAMRDRWKPIADAIELRGGEALAAITVFALGVAGTDVRVLGAIVAIASIAWLVGNAIVRRAYVAQFRGMIRAGEIRRDVRVPELDADSIELLVQALSSPDEVEALAALELLAWRRRMPALVLYHPSEQVVRRALALLEGRLRPDFANVLGHLLGHRDPRVRAAALAASSRTGAHRARLIAALDDRDVDVRAVAQVELVDDPEVGPRAAAAIAALVAGTTSDRHALAQAIEYTSGARFRGRLYELLELREPVVLHHVLTVLAREPELAELDRLLPLLADPALRGEVRAVMVAAGERALAHLLDAFDDPHTPFAIRRHLPRTISRFRSRAAARALCDRLLRERDGTTEFKLLRALGRMRSDQPELEIDEDALTTYVQRAVADADRYARQAERVRAEADLGAGTDLIAQFLDEKRGESIEHAFRGLGVLFPRASMRSVYDALVGDDEGRRSAAREVVESSLPSELRLALIDALDRKAATHDGRGSSHEELVAELLADPSESLRCVVAYHVAERRMTGLRGELERLRPPRGPDLVQRAFDEAIESLHA